MWKVRIEQHDGLRQVWRSMLWFARNSELRGDSLYRTVSQSGEKCITYGQTFLYCNNQSTVTAVPICTKLTNGWQYFMDMDGAEFRPNPSRSMESASRNWLITLREICPSADWRLFDNILYRKHPLNCMTPQRWFSRWQLVTERRTDIVSTQGVLLLVRKERLTSQRHTYVRYTIVRRFIPSKWK
jgi:hypothetical protein